MKKIIAMLLCVALVAAMSVSAFAAPKGTEVWDIEKWYEELSNPTAATGLKALAADLAGAKAAYAAQVKAYNEGITDAIKAVQAAQYATVAAYVDVATQLYAANAENAINKAIAQFELDLKAAIAPAASTSAIYDDIMASLAPAASTEAAATTETATTEAAKG